MSKPCLDHDHYDGKCRGVLGSDLNMFEGRVQNLWDKHMGGKTSVSLSEALRRLADYLEQDNSDKPWHEGIIRDLKKALVRRTSSTIVRNALDNFGVVLDESLDKAELIRQYLALFIVNLEKNYLYE